MGARAIAGGRARSERPVRCRPSTDARGRCARRQPRVRASGVGCHVAQDQSLHRRCLGAQPGVAKPSSWGDSRALGRIVLLPKSAMRRFFPLARRGAPGADSRLSTAARAFGRPCDTCAARPHARPPGRAALTLLGWTFFGLAFPCARSSVSASVVASGHRLSPRRTPTLRTSRKSIREEGQ